MFRKKVKSFLSPEGLKRIKVIRVELSLLSRVLVIFKNISYPSVVVATLVVWVFGPVWYSVWYSPLIFGDITLASPSSIDSMVDSGFPLIYTLIPLMSIFTNAIIIAGLAGICGISGWVEGFIFSIWLGLGLLVVSMLDGNVLLNTSTSMHVALIHMGYVYFKTLILCLFASNWHRKNVQLPAKNNPKKIL